MRCKNVGTSFFQFVTIHAFDRQTDSFLTVLCITCIPKLVICYIKDEQVGSGAGMSLDPRITDHML